VERTFLEDLKQTPLQRLGSFDRTPIATGSIGQVHTATMGTRPWPLKYGAPRS